MLVIRDFGLYCDRAILVLERMQEDGINIKKLNALEFRDIFRAYFTERDEEGNEDPELLSLYERGPRSFPWGYWWQVGGGSENVVVKPWLE